MKIDIEKLSEEELIELNNKIVAQLRFLRQKREHEKMLQFNIGDRVSFQPEEHPLVVGMLTRYNKKTVTIITDDGQRWNVAPSFLSKVEPGRQAEERKDNVVPLKRK